MIKELETKLEEASYKLSIDKKDLFNDAISACMAMMLCKFHMPDNAQFDLYKYELDLFHFDTKMAEDRLSYVFDIYHLLEEAMTASSPFEDVITPIYQQLFTNKRNHLGQHMTPPFLSEAVALFGLESQKPKPKAFLSDNTCGTGSLILAPMKLMYEAEGKHAFVDKTIYINDIDIKILRIAVLQILQNCFRHDVRIGIFEVRNSNAITDYERSGHFSVLTTFAKKGENREMAALSSLANMVSVFR